MGSRASNLRTTWGCDGGHSTARKQGGFVFEGTHPDFTGYSVQVAIAEPNELLPGRHYTTTWQGEVVRNALTIYRSSSAIVRTSTSHLSR
ncbi:hypothetical protein BH09MYX1_BH09MYX1_10840 [soil metagenome]